MAQLAGLGQNHAHSPTESVRSGGSCDTHLLPAAHNYVSEADSKTAVVHQAYHRSARMI